GALFDRQNLKNAVDAGANVQRICLRMLQSIESLHLLDASLLRLQPCQRGVRGDFRSLGFQRYADRQLLDANAGAFLGHVGSDAFFEKLDVHVVLNLGLLVVAADRGLRRLLVHQLAVHLNFQVGVIGFRALELKFGVHQFALQRRITHFQDDGRGAQDLWAGPDDDAVDTRSGLRRDPANIERHERPETTDFAHHRAALDLIGPDRRAIHRRSCWPELRQSVRDAGDKQQRNGNIKDAANLLRAGVGRSLYVHSCTNENATGLPQVLPL